jgi:DNA polymerase-3 subunit alpha
VTVKRSDFVHLHCHSHYSLLDGAAKISKLIARTKETGMHAIALTDHGNMFGAIEFYRTAMSSGVKPIIGCEAYMAPNSRHDRRTEPGVRESAYHLTMLARNKTGYQNLLKLSSLAYREGFYYKPRMDKEILSEYGEGLILLSGCPNAEVSHHLKVGKYKEAVQSAAELADIVGRDNFYVEIQDHGMDDEKRIQDGGLKLAKEMGFKVVCTNDVHYIEKADAKAHDALLCINTGKLIEDPNRLKYPSHDFYLKTPDEMKHLFREIPDAVLNTVEVAEKCNVELDFDQMHIPKFEAPDGLTPGEYLRKLCHQGLKKRYGKVTPEAKKRLEYELGVIENMGFVGYFLITWDFIRYARDHGIPVGPGRGSAVGSIVAYTLEITDLDPLRYDLLFERFLNPSRNEMPDIDIDFCMDRRGEVIDYVRDKYGADNVAQIITFGTMGARAVIRDVGRVMNIELSTVDRIAKKIPAQIGITLDKALEMEPELKEEISKDTRVEEMFNIAGRLEGLNRHSSTHAAGVVISDQPLTELVPLQVSKGEETTQWPMDMLTVMGMLKMDFLGLRTLTVIDRAVQLIEQTNGKRPDTDKLPLDDPATYSLLQAGQTRGVFQLESRGMRDLLQKMQPDCFEDLIAVLALFRPGPLQSGMVDQYVNVKHGRQDAAYLTPELEPILGETNGVILYQEQVMRIANILAGFSLSEADTLRKAMGKKKHEVLVAFKEQFVDGAGKNGIAEDTAEELFNQILFFAGYGFNKSHSTAYAYISYQTAWLKANYPIEFMAGLMSCDKDSSEKITGHMEDCRRMEIKVHPPDVNSSFTEFTCEDGGIRFGLGAVKGVGERAVEAVVEAREQLGGAFTSIIQFCEEVDIRACDKKAIEAMAKAGAFDGFGLHRSQVFEMVEPAMRMGSSRQKDKAAGQMGLFGTAQVAEQVNPPEIPEWDEATLLGFEKEALGFYVSSNPLVLEERLITQLSSHTISDLESLEDGEPVQIGCMLSGIRHHMIQSGKNAGAKMAFLQVQDFEAHCEAVIFTSLYDRVANLLVDDAVVFLKGRANFRNEDVGIQVDDVVPIEQAREELTAGVVVRLSAPGLEDTTIEKLQGVFAAHPGEIPVIIEVVTHDKYRVRIGTDSQFKVTSSDEFLADVETVIGSGHVELVPKKYQPKRRWQDKNKQAARSS